MKLLLLVGKQHQNLGGGEKYNFSLIKSLLEKGHEVEEMPFLPSDKSLSNNTQEIINNKKYKINNSFLGFWQGSKFKKIKGFIFLKKYINNFDIVINSGAFSHMPLNKNLNTIFVVHTSENRYSLSTKFKNPLFMIAFLFNFLLRYLGIQIMNPIRKSRNVVTYLEKSSNDNQDNFFVPMIIEKYSKLVPSNRKEEIIFVGRYLPKIKGLDYLSKISKIVKEEIHCYGSGEKEWISTSPFIVDHGLKRENEIPKIMANSRLLVITSRHEGSPIVKGIAYAAGTPVIFFDAIYHYKAEGKYLSKNIIKSFDINSFADRINEIIHMKETEYNELSNLCKEISKYIYSDYNKFSSQWSKIIKLVSSKNKS